MAIWEEVEETDSVLLSSSWDLTGLGDHGNGHCHSHSHRNVTHTGCWTTSPSWLTPPEAVYVTMCFYPQSHFSQFSLTARPQLCQKSLGIVTNISMQLKAVLTTHVTNATNKCNNYLMRRTHIIWSTSHVKMLIVVLCAWCPVVTTSGVYKWWGVVIVFFVEIMAFYDTWLHSCGSVP